MRGLHSVPDALGTLTRQIRACGLALPIIAVLFAPQIATAQLPDPVITAITPNRTHPGIPTTITFTVENQGPGDLPASPGLIQVILDRCVDNQSAINGFCNIPINTIGFADVPAIAAGQTGTATFQWTPTVADVGSYDLWGWVDNTGNPGSLDEVDDSTNQIYVRCFRVGLDCTGNGDGLTEEAFATADFTGLPVRTRVDPAVNFNWSAGFGNPYEADRPAANEFSVRWTGRIQAMFSETYTFFVRADAARLVVNGNEVFNQLTAGVGPDIRELSGNVVMSGGALADITLEYANVGSTNVSMVELQWSSPSTRRAIVPQCQLYSSATPPAVPPAFPPCMGAGDGQDGEYFNDEAFTAPAGVTRVDPLINFNFADATGAEVWPAPLDNDSNSVRWGETGGVIEPLYSETYTFILRSDDGAELAIDTSGNGAFEPAETFIGNLATNGGVLEQESAGVALTLGTRYRTRVRYREGGGRNLASLQWRSSNTPQSIVPFSQSYSASNLSPGPGPGQPGDPGTPGGPPPTTPCVGCPVPGPPGTPGGVPPGPGAPGGPLLFGGGTDSHEAIKGGSCFASAAGGTSRDGIGVMALLLALAAGVFGVRRNRA